MKFRQKPGVVAAVRWMNAKGGQDLADILALNTGGSGEVIFAADGTPDLIIKTLEGAMRVGLGDWIIRGVKGELYPCKPDIFEATYEATEGVEKTDIIDGLKTHNIKTGIWTYDE